MTEEWFNNEDKLRKYLDNMKFGWVEEIVNDDDDKYKEVERKLFPEWSFTFSFNDDKEVLKEWARQIVAQSIQSSLWVTYLKDGRPKPKFSYSQRLDMK